MVGSVALCLHSIATMTVITSPTDPVGPSDQRPYCPAQVAQATEPCPGGEPNLPGGIDEIRCSAGAIRYRLAELLAHLRPADKPEEAEGVGGNASITDLMSAAQREQRASLELLDTLRLIIHPIP